MRPSTGLLSALAMIALFVLTWLERRKLAAATPTAPAAEETAAMRGPTTAADLAGEQVVG